MTQALKGKKVEEAHQLYHRVHQMLTEEKSLPFEPSNPLAALAGVKAFPVRVKCASLAWHTLEAALNKEKVTVSTE
jgi:nitrogen fixation NifU-like protein